MELELLRDSEKVGGWAWEVMVASWESSQGPEKLVMYKATDGFARNHTNRCKMQDENRNKIKERQELDN